jgi:tryptophan synthase beta chain
MSTVDIPRPGRFGSFGGRYVSETLMPALEELTAAWEASARDASFGAELDRLFRDYVGRPTPLSEAGRLGAEVAAQRGRRVRII